MNNQTQTFLIDESSWHAANIHLRDVQGLWGGRLISVSGAGRTTVQVISPAMVEHRYQFNLDEAQTWRLLSIFIQHDFVSIECTERMGFPDEARPTIMLINVNGQRCTISKWAGVQEPRFDAIYAELLEIEALTENPKPIYSGPFDGEYIPEGFSNLDYLK